MDSKKKHEELVEEQKGKKVSVTYALKAITEHTRKLLESETLTNEEATKITDVVMEAVKRHYSKEFGL